MTSHREKEEWVAQVAAARERLFNKDTSKDFWKRDRTDAKANATRLGYIKPKPPTITDVFDVNLPGNTTNHEWNRY